MTNTNVSILRPLPLGGIKPAGWLANQLRIQANGLSGHLDEFWPDIKNSKWIGGQAEGWERFPYWLDGVIPLAVLLDDEGLKTRIGRYLDYILKHQHEDGWLGAKEDTHVGSGEHALDPWPMFILFKALAQWHEATGDARIVPAMTRAMERITALLAEKPLTSWAAMRWPDFAIGILWLHARTGEAWLLDLARTAQTQGYDWQAHFADFQYTDKQPQWLLENHVVNHAMALKEPAIRFLMGNGDAAMQREFAKNWIATLDEHHGQATGVFSGDESLAGRNPSQGTELCAVVEYLYSLEELFAAFGDPVFGDRLEKIAFNALPAAFKPDMWAHQYDQQANQVVCAVTPKGEQIYTNNSPDANLYGLEPCFGCCTANLHQGWPKFASHLWLRGPGDNTLTALAYAPCAVHVEIGGRAVTVETRTGYPFREGIEIAVNVAPSDGLARFALRLRVPGWAEGASVQTAGMVRTLAPGTFHAIEQDWEPGETIIRLHLPMPVVAEMRFNDAISLSRGPLVYALQIGEEWRQVKGEAPHADWEVHPTTPWNYALALDPARPQSFVQVTPSQVGDAPFSPHGAPVRLSVHGQRVPGWGLEHHVAASPPPGPVAPSGEPLDDLTLVPYGSTNLRVTEFPVLSS